MKPKTAERPPFTRDDLPVAGADLCVYCGEPLPAGPYIILTFDQAPDMVGYAHGECADRAALEEHRTGERTPILAARLKLMTPQLEKVVKAAMRSPEIVMGPFATATFPAGGSLSRKDKRALARSILHNAKSFPHPVLEVTIDATHLYVKTGKDERVRYRYQLPSGLATLLKDEVAMRISVVDGEPMLTLATH